MLGCTELVHTEPGTQGKIMAAQQLETTTLCRTLDVAG